MTKYSMLAATTSIIYTNIIRPSQASKERIMAFRQHNPNLVPSRQKGGQRWNSTKTNFEVPLSCGDKASLPSVQPATQHQRERIKTNGTFTCTERSSFLVDDYSHHGKENVPNPTNLESAASTSQPSVINRVPVFNRNLYRTGIHDNLCTDSPPIFSSDTLRLEKINRLGQNSTSGMFGQNECSAIPKTTGKTKYVEVARSCAMELSTKSSIGPPLTIFKDVESDRPHNEKPDAPSPSKSVHAYVHKLHSLSDVGDCGSAKEAEILLLEMISKYKAGLHDFQPDGGCYNR
jgi:hypothetical protein